MRDGFGVGPWYIYVLLSKAFFVAFTCASIRIDRGIQHHDITSSEEKATL
jgi:hypothetical protein